MTAIRPPAFQFYPKDFLSDAKQVALSIAGAGIYIRLLSHCWLEGSLPIDHLELAKLCGTTVAKFDKEWPFVCVCFEQKDGRLTHKRLAAERRKQATYRQAQRERGLRGAEHRWHLPSSGHGAGIKAPMAKNSSSSSSAFATAEKKEQEPSARSKRPIFTGQRLTVFEWQLDDLSRMLGRHTDGFDLHAWFFDLDAQAVKSDLVIPLRDGGKWLLAQTLAEAKRRGLRIADDKPRKLTAEEEAAEILAEVKRIDARVAQ